MSENKSNEFGRLMCPSYPTDRATYLLGVFVDGRVRFKSELIRVPVEVREASIQLSQAIRFAGSCIESGCSYWSGRCDLGDEIAQWPQVDSSASDNGCPITETCRWRVENGDNVCSACRGVMFVEAQQPLQGS